jgi:hypothetical protein
MINPQRFRPWKTRTRTRSCTVPPYACESAGGAPRSAGLLLRTVCPSRESR